MWSYLIKINKNLIIAIPAMMVAGFVAGVIFYQQFLKTFRYLITPLTFLMVYPMMVTLNIKHLQQGFNIKLQSMTQLINFGVIPFVGYLLGLLFFPDQPYMALGLLLASLLPTSGMTISWTGFARGDIDALANVIGAKLFVRGEGIALVYGTVMRNLSIALAIAINAFGEAGTNAALVIALAYVIQVQSAAWYVKLTTRFFGVPATVQR